MQSTISMRRSFVILMSIALLLCTTSCGRKSANSSSANPSLPTAAVSDSSKPATQSGPVTKVLKPFADYKAGLKISADSGDAEAANFLANIERAEKGNKEAQFWLGAAFRDGTLFQKDYADAFKYFSLSANQGYQPAQWFVGVMYEHGESVPTDLAKAKEWYTKSAQGNDKEWRDRANISLEYLKKTPSKK